MDRDARRVVSVSDQASRIDIGGRAITLIDGTIEAYHILQACNCTSCASRTHAAVREG
jgi:hypothetical protein